MSIESKLQIRVGLRMAKPAEQVFEAIVDPGKMSNYFISNGSGRMEEGATLQWQFPEMDMRIPVYINEVMPYKKIVFSWGHLNVDETRVAITLTAVSDDITFVVITESEKEPTDDGIRWLKSNTEGWANFLACMKAYLEYGINLRKGAFDPSQMPEEATTAG